MLLCLLESDVNGENTDFNVCCSLRKTVHVVVGNEMTAKALSAVNNAFT